MYAYDCKTQDIFLRNHPLTGIGNSDFSSLSRGGKLVKLSKRPMYTQWKQLFVSLERRKLAKSSVYDPSKETTFPPSRKEEELQNLVYHQCGYNVCICT